MLTTTTDARVRPYRIGIVDADLADLRERLARTRWPDRETVPDWAQGIPLGYVQELARYWRTEHDWAATVDELNRVGQFVTDVDGVDIHFVHVRSPIPDARPLLLVHGWPSSAIEFLDALRPLTEPADGGRAFHVVCPSLPGHGFSGRPTESGWTMERIATAFAELMRRLGYRDYIAQGGDWGSFAAAALGAQDAANIGGIHMSMPYAPEPDEDIELSQRDKKALATMRAFGKTRSGYAAIQTTRPQTIGYGLTDSPVGQLAFIAERFWEWADHEDDLFAVVSRKRLIDTVMTYWITNTATSAARLFWESMYRVPPGTIDVPTGCSVGPRDAWLPRAWCERRFTDLRYWHDLDHGGHFPALETPDQFAAELRAFERTL